MTIRAYAKINLDLHLAKRRPDGYHPIDTLMVRVDVFDTLEAVPTGDGTISLKIKGDDSLTPGSDNLVIRAASALQKHTGSPLGAELQLQKRIPQGAGLGGGSSDAAATLVLLQRLWNREVRPSDLHAIGSSLGSDVPFFLQPHAARGTGRGELLSPMPLRDLPWALLIHPGFGSPTAGAYTAYALDPRPGQKGTPLQLTREDGSFLKVLPQNDLEPAVETRFPWIASARTWMEGQEGVLASRMSGSGSTVFGLFPGKSMAEKASILARVYFGPETWIQTGRLLSGNNSA